MLVFLLLFFFLYKYELRFPVTPKKHLPHLFVFALVVFTCQAASYVRHPQFRQTLPVVEQSAQPHTYSQQVIACFGHTGLRRASVVHEVLIVQRTSQPIADEAASISPWA